MPHIDVDFHDKRISMCYWWPKVSELDINIPQTVLIPLEEVIETDDSGNPKSINYDVVIEGLNRIDGDSYFLRGDRKSADHLEEGGFLHTTELEGVKYTLECLYSSVLVQDFSSSAIVLREAINTLTIDSSYGCPIVPEVRVFIDDNDVLCHHSRITIDDIGRDTDNEPDYILEEVESYIESEFENRVKWQAEEIAENLDGGWSLDFIRSESGEWYFIDAALYALYYDELLSENGQWRSLSYHPDGCKYNLEENPPEELPENPENPREERNLKL